MLNHRPHILLKPLEERTCGQGLNIEEVSLERLLKTAQTPLYVTSLTAVQDRVEIYKSTLKNHFQNSNIFYACKANFAKPILQEVLHVGAGIDIVSIGEWRAALAAGYSPSHICFAGVGKKEEEWKQLILNEIGYINVEHISELEGILDFISVQKKSLKKIPVISLRLNPSLEIETHPHLKTGALDSKFGILFDHFKDWLLEKKQQLTNENFINWTKPLAGIHVHIGSQLMAKDVFVYTVKNVLDCALFMFEEGLCVHHLDFGGGLGVGVSGVSLDGIDIKEHVDFLCNTFKGQKASYSQLFKLWGENYENLFVCLEPGRSVVASSSVFLTTVMYTKINANLNESYQFCYVDGAMNDFPRPSLYGAEHECLLVDFNKPHDHNQCLLSSWQVVGPVCESGDFLSKDANLPSIKKKDILAFFEAGAYCRSMASQYNLRPLPNELFVKGAEIL